MKIGKLKNDAFRRRRGGSSRFYEILCSNCDTVVCIYQKDGPGILKRLYVDRIENFLNKEKILSCHKCKKLLGMLYVYKKESRQAYKLFVGAIKRKVVAQNSIKK